MFGYIRPVRNECDNYLFRSQYCGLCKCLGKRYGHFSRLFLSYDISLLTLLLQALSDQEFVYSYETCIMHPVNKRRVKKSNEIDQLAADLSVYFVKKKIEDNINDERWMRRWIFKGIDKIPMKWNGKITFKTEEIEHLFIELEKKEALKQDEMDEVSNGFGAIIKTTIHFVSRKLAIPLPAKFEEFSFFLGKLIYTLDAFEDLEKDIKKWRYNPLIYGNKEILLSIGRSEEVIRKIKEKEKWRVHLLLDHINHIYSTFRNLLGVYRFEIDGIISKSLPAMGYRVVGDTSIQQKKEIFHE